MQPLNPIDLSAVSPDDPEHLVLLALPDQGGQDPQHAAARRGVARNRRGVRLRSVFFLPLQGATSLPRTRSRRLRSSSAQLRIMRSAAARGFGVEYDPRARHRRKGGPGSVRERSSSVTNRLAVAM
jgi:hypothetical protein